MIFVIFYSLTTSRSSQECETKVNFELFTRFISSTDASLMPDKIALYILFYDDWTRFICEIQQVNVECWYKDWILSRPSSNEGIAVVFCASNWLAGSVHITNNWSIGDHTSITPVTFYSDLWIELLRELCKSGVTS